MDSGVRGGETWFPYAADGGTSFSAIGREEGEGWTVDRAISRALHRYEELITGDPLHPLEGVKIAPVAGKAVIFANHLPTGAVDPSAVHAGLPLRHSTFQGEGAFEKWIANYWVEMDDKVLNSYLVVEKGRS